MLSGAPLINRLASLATTTIGPPAPLHLTPPPLLLLFILCIFLVIVALDDDDDAMQAIQQSLNSLLISLPQSSTYNDTLNSLVKMPKVQ